MEGCYGDETTIAVCLQSVLREEGEFHWWYDWRFVLPVEQFNNYDKVGV